MRLCREIIVSARGVPAFSNFGYRSAGGNQSARCRMYAWRTCNEIVAGKRLRAAECFRGRELLETGQQSLCTVRDRNRWDVNWSWLSRINLAYGFFGEIRRVLPFMFRVPGYVCVSWACLPYLRYTALMHFYLRPRYPRV